MNQMYPSNYNPFDVINQAVSYQQPVAPSFPQMTPQSMGYHGPTHQMLSEALQAMLIRQATNPSLFSPTTAQGMGLLSNTMPQATAVGMPTTGGGALGPNQFYRLTPEFWNNAYKAPAAAAPATAPVMGTNPNSTVRDGSSGEGRGADMGNHAYSPSTGYGGGFGGFLGGLLGGGDSGMGGQLGQSMY